MCWGAQALRRQLQNTPPCSSASIVAVPSMPTGAHALAGFRSHNMHACMQNSESLFTRLVDSNGGASATALRRIAHIAHSRDAAPALSDRAMHDGGAPRAEPPAQSHHRKLSLGSNPYLQNALDGIPSHDGVPPVRSHDASTHSRHSRPRRPHAHARDRTVWSEHVRALTVDDGAASCAGFPQSAVEALSWRSVASVAPSIAYAPSSACGCQMCYVPTLTLSSNHQVLFH